MLERFLLPRPICSSIPFSWRRFNKIRSGRIFKICSKWNATVDVNAVTFKWLFKHPGVFRLEFLSQLRMIVRGTFTISLIPQARNKRTVHIGCWILLSKGREETWRRTLIKFWAGGLILDSDFQTETRDHEKDIEHSELVINWCWILHW